MITCKFTFTNNKEKSYTNEAVDFCYWDFLEEHSQDLDKVVFVEYTDSTWDVDMATGNPYWSEFHAVAFRKKYKQIEDDFKSGKSWGKSCLFGG